jgi:hypothetical protein
VRTPATGISLCVAGCSCKMLPISVGTNMFDSRQMKHDDRDKVVWPSAVPGTSKYDLWRFHHNLWDLGFESCSGGGLVQQTFLP